MLENLIFSLNATIPVFLMMVLGIVFRKMGFFTEDFTSKVNSFVFKVALPLLVFQDLSQEDFYKAWDTKYVLFCFFASLISIGIAFGVSFLVKKESRGEFVQASYRSSAAILGIGFIQNIYGTSGMAPLMIIGTVPLYNVMAVIILSFMNPENGKMDRALFKKTLIGVVTNPIIIGIVVGLGWSLLKIPQPVILAKSVKYLANLATPLGLMALGAGFEFKKVVEDSRPTLVACFMKLILFCVIFLPIAISLGFREDKLVAILVMLGSATTVSCYIMARNMGHKGTLTSGVVMVTTLGCAFSLTGWLFLLRTLGFI